MTRSPPDPHPCRSACEPVRHASFSLTGSSGVRAHTGLTSRPLHEGSITRSRRKGPRKHPPARTTRSHALRARERSCPRVCHRAARSDFSWSDRLCHVRFCRPVPTRPRASALPLRSHPSLGQPIDHWTAGRTFEGRAGWFCGRVRTLPSPREDERADDVSLSAPDNSTSSTNPSKRS
jgi:hypothetical protein